VDSIERVKLLIKSKKTAVLQSSINIIKKYEVRIKKICHIVPSGAMG